MAPNNNQISSLSNITVLGYSESYLALIFEYLQAINFKGKVNIITNEVEKRSPAPFKSGIPFNTICYTELTEPPSKNFIFCSNKPGTKKFLYDFYREHWQISRQDFLNIIDPSSVTASTAESEPGLQIRELAGVAAFSEIGFGVNIGRNSSLGHHNIIGDYCSINLGTNTAGHVEIGEGTTIGPGCTIFSYKKIGQNTIIGGGSVVTKDIPSNVLAYGNPCRIIRKLEYNSIKN